MPPSASTRSGGCWPRWCDTQRLRRAVQPLPPRNLRLTAAAAEPLDTCVLHSLHRTVAAAILPCTCQPVATAISKSLPPVHWAGVAELLRVLGCVVQVAVVGDHRATARATDAAVRSSAHRPALFPRDKSPATLMTFPPPLPSRPNARSHSLSLLTPDTPAHGRPNHIRSWTR